MLVVSYCLVSISYTSRCLINNLFCDGVHFKTLVQRVRARNTCCTAPRHTQPVGSTLSSNLVSWQLLPFFPPNSLILHFCPGFRFGALLDETGRFVWCCMDTYGGAANPGGREPRVAGSPRGLLMSGGGAMLDWMHLDVIGLSRASCS